MSGGDGSIERWLAERLAGLASGHLLRTLSPLEPIDAVHVRWQGRRLTLFSSNDYLGLSSHPVVRRAIAQAALEHGSGPRGSPLICGTTTVHQQLAAELAELTAKQRVLLFSSGYSANLGTIPALCDHETALFSDELNHASIVDACHIARRAGARVHVFRHCDPNHLESLLKRHPSRRRLIVTETVFSTQGDLAPLEPIAELKRRYDAVLVTDEGHAVLVFGERGGGLAEHQGLADQVDVQVGTLSKAAAGQGGFVACGASMADWILNRARSFIFSTAAPVALVAGVLAAVRHARRDPMLRKRLWGHVASASARLGSKLTSPIVPVMLEDEQRTLAASRALMDRGVHLVGLRPPTVPPNTCRLRITLSAAHSEAEIRFLFECLSQMDLIPAHNHLK